ncbi:MAG: hypothetical protein VKK62_10955 [Synechococcaceae cyanobacterium]|nr:hypothetical protein [Synechococcaceae cyanobacterium]
MERHLILLLACVAVGVGTSAAVGRPGVFVLGESVVPTERGASRFGTGVYWRSRGIPGPARSGGLRAGPGGRAGWERFQGRGPGGAK